MICPHCKKAIKRGISADAWKRARELRKEGYSLREVEKILFSLGISVSYSTLSRRLR